MTPKRNILTCLLLTAVIILGGLSAGCGRGNNNLNQKYKYPDIKKIGVVLNTPEKSDAAVNEAVINGVVKAAADLDAEYKLLTPGELVNNEESLRYLAENNYDLVVAVGQDMEEDLRKVSPDYPDINFAIFNGKVKQKNVTGVLFNEEDGAFLAGIAAACLTKTNIVGCIGESSSSGRNLESGFAKGIQYINSTEGKLVKVNVSYAGEMEEEMARDQDRGKYLASVLYWNGADVIFSGAGTLDRGAVTAATENKKMIICSGLELMPSSPWNVCGTLTKNQEKAVYDIVKKTLGGNFNGGAISYGAAEGAVDLVLSQSVPQEITGKLNTVKDQLRRGEIKLSQIQIPQDLVTQIRQP